MSLRAIIWAFDQIRAKRSPSASCSLVLLKLADRANDDGVCWPGQARLGADVDLSDETVRQCCRLLAREALIQVIRRRGNDGRDITNLYRLVGFEEGQNFTTPQKSTTSQNLGGESPKSGGKPPKGTSQHKTTTPVVVDIDEVVEAGIWAERRVRPIKNELGLRRTIRLRAESPQGPNQDDLYAHALWKAEQARIATERDVQAQQQAEDAARSHESAERTAAVDNYLASLDGAAHDALVAEFGRHLEAGKNSYLRHAFTRGGVTQKSVVLAFTSYVADRLRGEEVAA